MNDPTQSGCDLSLHCANFHKRVLIPLEPECGLNNLVRAQSFTVFDGPSGVPSARRWVVDTCISLGLPELTECAELAVSELVTNSLMHGRAPIEVRFLPGEPTRIQVHDSSPDMPVMSPNADPLALGGRGMALVARCAIEWGVATDDTGKMIWFEPATFIAEVPEDELFVGLPLDVDLLDD
jgi:anti-sigma regulatory factor (Ser/Thr protein kinase)